VSANGTCPSQGGRPARDIAGIRRVEVQTLFGADSVVVDDFASTAVTAVHVNLARVLAGGVGGPMQRTGVSRAATG
jgi:hypothetical protein